MGNNTEMRLIIGFACDCVNDLRPGEEECTLVCEKCGASYIPDPKPEIDPEMEKAIFIRVLMQRLIAASAPFQFKKIKDLPSLVFLIGRSISAKLRKKSSTYDDHTIHGKCVAINTNPRTITIRDGTGKETILGNGTKIIFH